jgi:hypothetical protein
MTTLAIHSESRQLIKPEPRLGGPISVRAATEADLPFIDALQKKHNKAVAFASHKELRSYIEQGQTALVAEECERDEEMERRRDEETKRRRDEETKRRRDEETKRRSGGYRGAESLRLSVSPSLRLLISLSVPLYPCGSFRQAPSSPPQT